MLAKTGRMKIVTTNIVLVLLLASCLFFRLTRSDDILKEKLFFKGCTPKSFDMKVNDICKTILKCGRSGESSSVELNPYGSIDLNLKDDNEDNQRRYFSDEALLDIARFARRLNNQSRRSFEVAPWQQQQSQHPNQQQQQPIQAQYQQRQVQMSVRKLKKRSSTRDLYEKLCQQLNECCDNGCLLSLKKVKVACPCGSSY